MREPELPQTPRVPPVAYRISQCSYFKKKGYPKTIHEGFIVGETNEIIIERSLKVLADIHFKMFALTTVLHCVVCYLAYILGSNIFLPVLFILSVTSLWPSFHFFAGGGYHYPVANNWFGQLGKKWEVFARGLLIEMMAFVCAVALASFCLYLSFDYIEYL